MPKVRVNSKIVCCYGDKNDEGSGHPLIYLDTEEGEVSCPYCGTNFTFVHDCTVEKVKEKTMTKDELF